MKDVISAGDLNAIVQPPRDEEPLQAKAHYAVSIAVDQITMTIRFDDERCASLFAERFADLLVPSVGSLTHYAVRTSTGYLFWSPGGQGWSWDYGPLSPDAVVFLADATATGALIRSSSRLVSFHAAAIAYEGIAAAISGDSNAGKTTTAIACARRGMGLYSDERCVVRDDLVVPFARTLQIRDDGLQLLARDGVDGELLLSGQLHARRDRDAVRVPISTLFAPKAIPGPAQLRAVIVLSGREERARLERIAWFEAAPVLMRWMESKDQGLPRAARLVQALREAWCFRLVLGSPDASALLVRAALSDLVAVHAG